MFNMKNVSGCHEFVRFGAAESCWVRASLPAAVFLVSNQKIPNEKKSVWTWQIYYLSKNTSHVFLYRPKLRHKENVFLCNRNDTGRHIIGEGIYSQQNTSTSFISIHASHRSTPPSQCLPPASIPLHPSLTGIFNLPLFPPSSFTPPIMLWDAAQYPQPLC